MPELQLWYVRWAVSVALVPAHNIAMVQQSPSLLLLHFKFRRQANLRSAPFQILPSCVTWCTGPTPFRMRGS